MSKVDLSAPSALIIVDAWRTINLYAESPLRNIIPLYQNLDIQCVIFASYPNNGNVALAVENPPFNNSNKLFSQSSHKQLTKQWQEYTFNSIHGHKTNPNYKGGYSFKEYPCTHEYLLYGFPLGIAYSAWTVNQASYILNTVAPQIKNIYLAGGAWNMCLHDRPLGIDKLTTAIKCRKFNSVNNLLIDPSCVYDEIGAKLSVDRVPTEDWAINTYTDINKNPRTVLIRKLKSVTVDRKSLQWQDFDNPYYQPKHLKHGQPRK